MDVRIKRQKAEEEIKKAFRDSLNHVQNHLDLFKKFWTGDLKKMVEERLSKDTKNRYMDIIYKYLNEITSYSLTLGKAERELLKALGSKRKHIF